MQTNVSNTKHDTINKTGDSGPFAWLGLERGLNFLWGVWVKSTDACIIFKWLNV